MKLSISPNFHQIGTISLIGFTGRLEIYTFCVIFLIEFQIFESTIYNLDEKVGL